MSASAIKVSELSSFDISHNNINFSFVLVYDTINTGQSLSGSVVISSISSILNEFWAISSNGISSMYATVNTNSATTWNYQGTDIKDLSSNWQNTFINFGSQSANNNLIFNNIIANSAAYLSSPDMTLLNSTSANWNSVYTTVNTNSSVVWNYQGTDIKSISSNWQETYTGFSSQSSNNSSIYTTVNLNSAGSWVTPDGTKLPLSGGDITGPVSISAGTITNIPLTQIILSANHISVLSDGGKHFYHPVSDNNPRTFTIAPNAAVPYPIGTTLTFVNDANIVTISVSSDTMVLAGGVLTGDRTLSATGMATALKVTNSRWVIGGANLS